MAVASLSRSPASFPLHAWEGGGRARGVGAEGVAGGSGRPAGAGGEASGHRLSPDAARQRLRVSLWALGPGGRADRLTLRLQTGLLAGGAVRTAGLGTVSGFPRFYREGLWL